MGGNPVAFLQQTAGNPENLRRKGIQWNNRANSAPGLPALIKASPTRNA
jgi:hypothetical protein